MELTNQQIQDATMALVRFGTAKLSYKTKLRIARNLRKLNIAQQDFESLRVALAHQHIRDKTKIKDNNQQNLLSPEEQLTFLPELRKLLQEKQTVEIHPIEIYDSRENMKPADKDCSIDEADISIPSEIKAALIDIILIEPKE